MKFRYLIPYIVIAVFLYQFAKDSLSYSSPFFVMGTRYLIAGLFLLLISRRFLFNRDTIILSLLTTSSTVLWAYGLVYVSPADSAVLSYTMPLISIFSSWALLNEKATLKEVVGAVIGFSGVVIFSIRLLTGFLLLGSVLTLVNAIFWSLYSVYFRKMKENDPVSVVGSQFLLGSLFMLILSPIGFKLSFTGEFVIDLLYLSLLGGVAQFLLWDLMLREEKMNIVTTSIFAVPALTMLVQALETLTAPSVLAIVGVAIMFLGIYISQSVNKPEALMRSKTNSSTAQKE
ncbi:MAG TPA: DMT family transporter [Candidatus Bathyarchaeia archaeon]|nr:DMT family transporter [Candidatus Bathyarchaeia archaeon]